MQNGYVILGISALGVLGGDILRTIEEFLAQTCVQQVHKHTDNRSGHCPAQNIAGIMDIREYEGIIAHRNIMQVKGR